MPLTGSLDEINVGALVQTLSMDGKRGTLRISDGRQDRFFYLDQDEITLYVPSAEGPLRIGELLVRAEKITEQDLGEALERGRDRDALLGQILCEMGVVTEEEIDEVIRERFHEEFFEICLLREGSFEFLFEVHPRDLIGADETFSRVSMNTSNLIMEALRQIDEWGEMRKAIPTGKAIFVRQIGADESVDSIDVDEDVKRGIQMIDGRLTVDDLLRVYDDSKFRLYTLLHELLERDIIRPLSVEELKELALEAELHSNWMQAARYYEYAIFQEPRNNWIRKRYYNLLRETERDFPALEQAVQIGEVHLDEGEVDDALTFFQAALSLDDRNVRALHGVFRCYRRQAEEGDASLRGRARTVGEMLVQELIRLGRFSEARTVLEPLVEEMPEEPRYARFEAEILDGLHEREEAIRAYERAANLLMESPRQRQELIEVLRRLLELDPTRSDAREHLSAAEAAEEVARRRRRVHKIGLVAAGLLLVALVLGIALVELPARSLLRRAEAAEEAGDLRRAESLYRLAGSYRFASISVGAREKAEELAGRLVEAGPTGDGRGGENPATGEGPPLDPGSVPDVRGTSRVDEGPPTTPFGEASVPADPGPARPAGPLLAGSGPAAPSGVPAKEDEARALLAEAEAREAAGDLEGAARALGELLDRHPGTDAAEEARFPVAVRSIPPGATVRVEGRPAGETPVVCHLSPGAERVVRITAPGFEPAERLVRPAGTRRVEVALVRRPAWEARLPAPPAAPPVATSDRVIVLTREGALLGLGRNSGDVRWEVAVGTGASEPVLAGDRVFCVREDGMALQIDATSGAEVWRTSLPAGVRGRATFDPEGLLGVRGVDGVVRFLAARTGQPVWRFEHGGERGNGVLSVGSHVYIAGRNDERADAVCDHLHLFDRDTFERMWTFDAEAPVTGRPVVASGGEVVVLGTEAGQVWAVGAGSGEIRWRAGVAGVVRSPILACPGGVVVADGTNTVSSFDPVRGELRWSLSCRDTVRGLTADGGLVYLGTEAGEILAIDESTAAILWRQDLGAPVATAAAVGPDRVYVATGDGRVLAFDR